MKPHLATDWRLIYVIPLARTASGGPANLSKSTPLVLLVRIQLYCSRAGLGL